MKKRDRNWVIFLLIFLTWICLFNLPAESRASEISNNLIVNAGIEQLENDSPPGWYEVGLFHGVKFSVDNNVSYKGRRSLAIVNSNEEILRKYGPANWAQNVTDNIPLNKVVTLTVHMKTQDVKGHVAVALQCWEEKAMVGFGTTQMVRPLTGTNEWTELSFGVKIPEETDKLRILCMLAGTGKAWFDNLSLREGGRITEERFLTRFKGPYLPGQKAGLIGGTLGAVVGIAGTIIWNLCARNRKKHQKLLITYLFIVTFLGASLLLLGIYSYLVKLMHPDYRYGLVLVGIVLLFVGGPSWIRQIRYGKQIEEFKARISKIE